MVKMMRKPKKPVDKTIKSDMMRTNETEMLLNNSAKKSRRTGFQQQHCYIVWPDESKTEQGGET